MNWKESIAISSAVLMAIGFADAALATESQALAQLSKESKACLDCHRETSRGIYEQWGQSLHYRANVGCYELKRRLLKQLHQRLAAKVEPINDPHPVVAPEQLANQHRTDVSGAAGDQDRFHARGPLCWMLARMGQRNNSK